MITEIKPADLQELSEKIRVLYVRCNMTRLRLLFLELTPTAELTAELLAEIKKLRAELDAVYERHDQLDYFARAAAKMEWEGVSDDFVSIHALALQASWRFMMAICWHGQYNVQMPEAITRQPPDDLVALDTDVVGRIARDQSDDFAIENMEVLLQREAATAAAELGNDRAAGEGNEELQRLRMVVDDDEYQAITATVTADGTCNDKLMKLYRLNPKYIYWEGEPLSRLLGGVTQAAIRKTDAWREYRKKFLEIEARKSVHTGEL